MLYKSFAVSCISLPRTNGFHDYDERYNHGARRGHAQEEPQRREDNVTGREG